LTSLIIIKARGSTERTGRMRSITDFEEQVGDYTEGRYAWELDQMKRLQNPVPAKGYLSLWHWEKSSI